MAERTHYYTVLVPFGGTARIPQAGSIVDMEAEDNLGGLRLIVQLPPGVTPSQLPSKTVVVGDLRVEDKNLRVDVIDGTGVVS